MSTVKLRLIEKHELNAAIALEKSCYSEDAAATLEGFRYRYEHYRPFFWSAWIGDRLVGIANGIRTFQNDCGDEMKGTQGDAAEGRNFCVLTVAVDKEQRRQGIGALLMQKLVEQCEEADIEKIILMCEKHLIPFYEDKQFRLHGPSSSTHGGITWYEMSRTLHTMEHLTE